MISACVIPAARIICRKWIVDAASERLFGAQKRRFRPNGEAFGAAFAFFTRRTLFARSTLRRLTFPAFAAFTRCAAFSALATFAVGAVARAPATAPARIASIAVTQRLHLGAREFYIRLFAALFLALLAAIFLPRFVALLWTLFWALLVAVLRGHLAFAAFIV